MSEEEFFNRMINQISKVFDGRIATKMKNIYLKKDKQLNKQKEVLDKIKEIFKDYGDKEDIVTYSMYQITGEEVYTILELLEEIE